MITQAIKGWFKRLFAWWPWKKTVGQDYVHPVSSLHQGIAQEPMLWTPVDRPTPQPSITSVIVEQERDTPAPEFNQPQTEERSERPVPPHPLISDDMATQLAFLKYLVKRGIVNEGFTPGQEPDQYQQ